MSFYLALKINMNLSLCQRTTYILVVKSLFLWLRERNGGAGVRDKWRDKQWVVVNAPVAFGGNPLSLRPHYRR